MSKQNAKRTRKAASWIALRRHLGTLDKHELIALVKDLYDTSDENRDFIQARCQAGESGGEILEKYRGKFVEQCPASIGFPTPGKSNCRSSLGTAARATEPLPSDYKSLYETVTGDSLKHCPSCRTGNMKFAAPLVSLVSNGAHNSRRASVVAPQPIDSS